MAESIRPLLPKGSLPPEPPPPPPPVLSDFPHKQKRKLTLAACEPCRKRKSKCDGNRPCCSACVSKPELCIFEIKDANLSRTAALKQKIEGLEGDAKDTKDLIQALESNLSIKSELLEYLRTRPEQEAQIILHRWRTLGDVDSVVQYVRDGDLLIHSFAATGSSGKSPTDFDGTDLAK